MCRSHGQTIYQKLFLKFTPNRPCPVLWTLLGWRAGLPEGCGLLPILGEWEVSFAVAQANGYLWGHLFRSPDASFLLQNGLPQAPRATSSGTWMTRQWWRMAVRS